MQGVPQAHAEARQKAEREHDYTFAAQLLEKVPEHLRDGSLYAAVCGKRDRADSLEKEVRAAVQAMRLAGYGRRSRNCCNCSLSARTFSDCWPACQGLPPWHALLGVTNP
jgi:hypothetical protein